MKKILISIATILAFNVLSYAQTPEKMQYQAVARDNSGAIIANQSVGFKIAIVQGSANGTVVYEETHNSSTNAFGLVNLQIGGGSPLTGTMSAIDWSNGPFYVKTYLDANGGTNYQLMGTSQLLSVPYALHAKSADNTFSGDYNDLSNKPTNLSGFTNDAGYITSPDDADADPTNELQTLSLSGSDLTLSNGGGTVTLPLGGGSSIIVIDNTNYNNVTVTNDDVVNIQGTVTVSANYTKLNNDGMSISGGKFIGSGTEEIRFGNNSVVKGVKFENVTIDAHRTTVFIGCKFTNVSSIGFESAFNGCEFYNCNTTSVLKVGRIVNSKLYQCTIPRMSDISNSYISNCVLGGDYGSSSNLFNIGNITGCRIFNSKLYSRANSITGNFCDGVAIYLYEGAFGTISGNEFDGLYTGLSSFIIIDVTGTWYSAINITGNVFFAGSASPHISVTGSFSGSYCTMKISDNSFNRGSVAVTNSSSNVRMVVTNNVLRSVGSLGVSGNGNTVVRDNDSF